MTGILSIQVSYSEKFAFDWINQYLELKRLSEALEIAPPDFLLIFMNNGHLLRWWSAFLKG